MKPTAKKTRAAKRPAKKYSDLQSKLIGKLLDLKYRINQAYRGGADDAYNDTIADKGWVMNQIDDIRNGRVLSKRNMLRANSIWKRYKKYETKSI